MIRLALRVRRDEAEVALAELLELSPSGIEEVDLGDAVEYAIYGAPGELPTLPALKAVAGGALVDISTSEVADDWDERWRAFHRPVLIAGRLHVRPPWSAGVGLTEVVIDPGQAFGTGAHETTRSCLELLLELEPGGGFVDVGCGSGVLAIAAAKLGWEPVLGVDHDPEALDATIANARANGVRVRTERHDLLRDGPVAGARTVAANLLRPLLLCLAEQGFRDDRPKTLITGGLLAHEADEVATALASRLGLQEVERRKAGDWVAVLMQAG